MVNDPLYQTLNSDPNVIVYIVNGTLAPDTYGETTAGNSQNMVLVTIDQAQNVNDANFMNTLYHELTHAEDVITGNYNTDINSQNNDKGFAKATAQNAANDNYPAGEDSGAQCNDGP